MITTDSITSILNNTLPESSYINVVERKNYFGGGSHVKIFFACSAHDINNVAEQKPQAVSLHLNLEDLELQVQHFGGMGGQRIYREVDSTNPKESWLAMVGIKIPFRKPKQEPEAVLKAIERFAQNWIKTIRENKEVLQYRNIVNYDLF